MVPVVTASASRFGGAFDAPTFKELGYDIEFQIYRGVAGPADMPEEAVKFWSNVFKQVSETKAWQEDYIAKFLLVPHFIPNPEATAYMQTFEDIFTGK